MNDEQTKPLGFDKAGARISIINSKYAKDLVRRLNHYEKIWLEHTIQCPEASESMLHRWALETSGLLGDGLMTARAYAGLYCTARPGIVATVEPKKV